MGAPVKMRADVQARVAIAREIRVAYRVSVHCRVVERRQIDWRTDVICEHASAR
jgi:hypothetical protein